MAGMNLKGKGVFVLCMLHLPFINHNYIASSVITPRILNLKEPILLQSLIVSFKLFESVDFFSFVRKHFKNIWKQLKIAIF